MKAGLSSAVLTRGIAADLLLQLGSTIQGLRRGAPSVLQVHQTRNKLTRMRASLRLLRRCIGNGTYHRCNRVIRDAGRHLNAARDAEVLIETAEQLGNRTDSIEMKRTIHIVVEVLKQQQATGDASARADHKSIAALRAIRREVKELSQAPLVSVVPKKSLGWAYSHCRRAFRRAQKRPTDANLHEWRKQMKYAFCETAALSRCGDERISRLHSEAGLLATYLGDDHDLAILKARVGELLNQSLLNNSPSVHKLTQRIKQVRATLQAGAFRLGVKCFRRRPMRYRLHDRWLRRSGAK